MIHVPDPAGAFMADHAGADRRPGAAHLGKEPAVRWLGDPPENLIADTSRMFGDMPEHNTELFLRIIVLKLLFEPQA